MRLHSTLQVNQRNAHDSLKTMCLKLALLLGSMQLNLTIDCWKRLELHTVASSNGSSDKYPALTAILLAFPAKSTTNLNRSNWTTHHTETIDWILVNEVLSATIQTNWNGQNQRFQMRHSAVCSIQTMTHQKEKKKSTLRLCIEMFGGFVCACSMPVDVLWSAPRTNPYLYS